MKKTILVLLAVLSISVCNAQDDSGVDFLTAILDAAEEQQAYNDSIINVSYVTGVVMPFGRLIVAGPERLGLFVVETTNQKSKILFVSDSKVQMLMALEEILTMGNYDKLKFGELEINRDSEGFRFGYNYEIKVKYVEQLLAQLKELKD